MAKSIYHFNISYGPGNTYFYFRTSPDAEFCAETLNRKVRLLPSARAKGSKLAREVPKLVARFLRQPTEDSLTLTESGRVEEYRGAYFHKGEEFLAARYAEGFRYVQVEIPQ